MSTEFGIREIFRNTEQNDKTIIGYAITKFHVFCFLSYTKFITDSNNNVNICLFIIKHPNGFFVIDDLFINLIKVKYNITVIKNYTGFPRMKNNIKNKFVYLLSPQFPWLVAAKYFKNHENVSIITYDDGIASYESTLHWIIKEKQEKGVKSFLKLIIKVIATWFYEKTKIYKIFHMRLLEFKENDKRYDKTIFFEYYKQTIKNIVTPFATTEDSSAIFYTQPYSFNEIEENIYFEILKNISSILIKKNILLFIKTHPRDSKDKYLSLGYRLIPEDVIGESILSNENSNIKFVFGLNTSMLVFHKIYNNDLKVISICMVNQKMFLDKSVRKFSKSFSSKYKSLIDFPKSSQDLAEALYERQ
jgi:hypothetical protein